MKTGSWKPIKVTISIVAYRSDAEQFQKTIDSLRRAVEQARKGADLIVSLFIIDNEVKTHANHTQAEGYFSRCKGTPFDEVVLRVSPSNLGYGRGHNVAIFESRADYYLVLNPDVLMDEGAIEHALRCMEDNPCITVVTPRGESPEGEPLYLCKRFPLVFDLLLRGFAPAWLRRRFERYIARYEMHELRKAQNAVFDIPIVSGCCMLLRGSFLRQLGGFDERYFLYFEDFDLSLRLGNVGSNVYLPAMKIVHYGGHAARKGLWHILLFARSALRFYSQYGWRWFRH